MSDPRPIVTPQERGRLLARIQASTVHDGDCALWSGACSASRQPVINFRGVCRYVRGLVYEAHHGVPVPAGMVMAARCRHPRCIDLDCMRPMSTKALRKLDARRGAYSGQAHNAARLVAARKRARIPEAVVQQVREFVGTNAQAAQAAGISKAHATGIRAGRARRPLVSVWAGLMP